MLATRRTKLTRLKEANSALLREDVARRVSTYRGLPEVVTLNHTDICNLRCVMCPRNLAQGTHRLEERVLSHVANQLFPTAKKVVLTTSEGEPLGADFDFLLERALHFEVKIDAVTNGVLLTPKLYRRARRAFDHLNVSLDSHIPEIYERIRLGSSHARVFGQLEEIGAMRREDPDDVLFSVSAVVMASNLPHLSGFVRRAAELGVDGVVFQRMLQDTKSTPEEALEPDYSYAEVMQALDEASATAREVGMNLFLSEFSRPNVMVSPLRAKVAPIVQGHGTCWFIAQDFNVMYTGEVYPCCIPTDHKLGNVLYEDPVEIWNGPAFRKLREAHLSGRGTPFCNGCIHAPHLPAPRSPRANRAIRKSRMAIAHVKNKVVRRLREKFDDVIFDPRPPELQRRELTLGREEARARAIPSQVSADVLDVDADTGRACWLGDGALWRADDYDDPATHERLASDLDTSPGATVLRVNGSVLFAFEGGGQLRRWHDGELSPAIDFSDPRSFARRSSVDVDANGTVWIGEYGVHPGARCARLYRSDDGGGSFRHVTHFRSARHIHLVRAFPSHGIIVTTGDLASERRLFVGDRTKRFAQVRDAWSGFTAAAAIRGGLQFGTDLNEHNGFLRFVGPLGSAPEFRQLPPDCDAPLRTMLALDDERLLAWCRVDDDAPHFGDEVWGALLLSEDAGSSWSIVHRSIGPRDVVPEGIELLGTDPIRVATVLTTRPQILEVR